MTLRCRRRVDVAATRGRRALDASTTTFNERRHGERLLLHRRYSRRKSSKGIRHVHRPHID